jgi:hypothetical protein
MNRKQRRAAKTVADGAAAQMAAAAFDYTAQGQLVRVTHPKAVAALQRAFALMIEGGCHPIATRIPHSTAETFPRAIGYGPEVASYLAVGLDPEGRGTYSLRAIVTPDAPPALADQYNRQAALECLRPLTASRGFPIWAGQRSTVFH